MEKDIKNRKSIIAWFVYASSMIIWLLVDAVKQQSVTWILIHSAAALIFLGSIRGVWFHGRWAVNMSLVVAAYFLGLGIYLAYVGWNLWVFQTPTLFDQIRAAFPLHVILLTVAPVLWAIFCAKKIAGE